MTTTPSGSVPFATADLVDAHGAAALCCDLQFRQYGAKLRFSGRISTVECCDDNVLLEAALCEDGSGRVLVVDGRGSLHCALMGDRIATLAMTNGWAGVVIHGAVRDTLALRELDLGIKALGSNPRKSGKSGAGARDVGLSFGSAVFTPGAELYSDEDGLVVLNRG